jgi:uncharacterized repeat protein (TIGR01451 family)
MLDTGNKRRRTRAMAGAVVAAVALTLAGAGPAFARAWTMTTIPVSAQEGVEFSGAVACINLEEGSFSDEDFTATIDWGDGSTPSASTGISGTLDGPCGFASFAVLASHTYAKPGTYSTLIRVDDLTDGSWQQRSATATVTALPNDLGVSLGASPNPVRSGSKLTYTTKVANSGSSIASNVWLTNTLPAHTQFLSLSATPGTCFTPAVGTTGTIACQLGTLAGSAGATMTVTVKVVAPGGTSISDSASVGADDDDPFSANNSATVSTSVFGRK